MHIDSAYSNRNLGKDQNRHRHLHSLLHSLISWPLIWMSTRHAGKWLATSQMHSSSCDWQPGEKENPVDIVRCASQSSLFTVRQRDVFYHAFILATKTHCVSLDVKVKFLHRCGCTCYIEIILKGILCPKKKCCHLLFLQTCIIYFIVRNTKWVILKNVQASLFHRMKVGGGLFIFEKHEGE